MKQVIKVPLCYDAWPIPPSPLMIKMGNDYYTCSICGRPCDPPKKEMFNGGGKVSKVKQVIMVTEDGEIMVLKQHLAPIIEKLVFDDQHNDMWPEGGELPAHVHSYSRNGKHYLMQFDKGPDLEFDSIQDMEKYLKNKA